MTVGMAMTEKQGGSDLRATTTTARGRPRSGGQARPTCHGPQMVLLRADERHVRHPGAGRGGLSCFIATGWLPDGTRNRLKIQRLKDKCGNKSNAARGRVRRPVRVMLGEEGRGIGTIIEMAHRTRLDFAIGSSGLMRQALSQTIHHTTNRRAFQRPLVDLPVMRNVVADLAVELEAMMWMSMRLAPALDHGAATARRDCSLASHAGRQVLGLQARAAIRCRGARMPWGQRLHRRPPHGAALSRGASKRDLGGHRQCHLPGRPALYAARARHGRGPPRRDPRRRAAPMPGSTRSPTRSSTALPNLNELEPVARSVVEMMALCLQASLLVRHSTPAVADAFCATRLDGDWGRLRTCRRGWTRRPSSTAPESGQAEASTPTLRVGTSLGALSPNSDCLEFVHRPHAGRLCTTPTTAFATRGRRCRSPQARKFDRPGLRAPLRNRGRRIGVEPRRRRPRRRLLFRRGVAERPAEAGHRLFPGDGVTPFAVAARRAPADLRQLTEPSMPLKLNIGWVHSETASMLEFAELCGHGLERSQFAQATPWFREYEFGEGGRHPARAASLGR